MKAFRETIKNRRNIYHLGKSSENVKEKVKDLLETAVLHAPSPFHMQSQRAVLLMGAESHAFWKITEDALAPIVPPDQFEKTKSKLAAFAAGDGTILYFDDTAVTQSLMKTYPLYAVKFPVWAQRAGGMLQYAVWGLLTEEGLGASLQHYNPVVDEAVKKRWNLPDSWELLAQMPFGKILTPPEEKDFAPIEKRVLVF